MLLLRDRAEVVTGIYLTFVRLEKEGLIVIWMIEWGLGKEGREHKC